jgi:hypothetical protein
MKHLAVIQSEFLKQARKWEELSLEDQKAYLKRHPGSKRKLTTKPAKSDKKWKMIGDMLNDAKAKSTDGYVPSHSDETPVNKVTIGDHVVYRDSKGNLGAGKLVSTTVPGANKYEILRSNGVTTRTKDVLGKGTVQYLKGGKVVPIMDNDKPQEQDDDKIEQTIKDFSDKYASAAEMWMSDEKKAELSKLIDSKQYKFKSIVKDGNKFDSGDDIQDYIKSVESKGWKLFDDDDGGEQLEFIFHKKK